MFILAVGIGLIFFYVVAQKTIDSSSQERMKTNVARQSEHLRTILNIHYSYLEGVAEKIAESNELMNEENKEVLTVFQKNTSLDRLALIDPEGNAYYDNGVEKNVSHRRYFKEGISSCNVGELSQMLFDDLFSGNGYSLIVTKEGKIVAHTGEPVDHKLSYGEDIFTFYESKTTREGHSIGEVKQNFAMGEEGLVRLAGYADGSDRYLAYAPLGINDWMICYVASVTVAQQSYAFVEKYEMVFLGCFGILVCLLILYIIRKNRQKTEAILHSAQTDELTQVYSRKYAEQFAENALEEAKDGSIHAFFIMDIDKFKEVNDVYGHAVGDVVLRTFGVLLGRQFRGDDIVGRIGGDEFIILMRNVTTKEAVRTKAEQLMAETKKLVFDEMNGKGITISVGIALAPEHGKTYMNLYRSADQALYETKRNGRNGFAIYGENRDITKNR